MHASSWINEELRQSAGLEHLYPFDLVRDLRDENGNPLRGLALTKEGRVVLTLELRGRRSALSCYLHEVGHLIAFQAQIDHDPNSMTHNKYFAALVAMMYRRVGLLDRLKVYDFGDRNPYRNGYYSTDAGKEGEEGVDGAELVGRFAYIVERSKFLAESNMSVEAAARWLYREDVFPAWTGRSWHAVKRSGWSVWWPLAAGASVGLVTVLAVVGF